MPHFNSALFERVLAFSFDAEAPPRRHCCQAMTQGVTYRCPEHPNPFDCGDTLVVYAPPFDEYGLMVHDGGASYVLIRHCPWCGARLPESRRDDWFDALEAIGIDAPLFAEIPEPFKTDAWYRNAD